MSINYLQLTDHQKQKAKTAYKQDHLRSIDLKKFTSKTVSASSLYTTLHAKIKIRSCALNIFELKKAVFRIRY